MASLREIFSQIMEEQFEPLGDGELLSLDISPGAERGFGCRQVSGAGTARGPLLAFERHVVQAMGLRSFSLYPKYTPDKLCAEYFPELVEQLKTMSPMVNGYFDNASASFTDDGRCIVSLQHGGGDILRAAKVDMSAGRG